MGLRRMRGAAAAIAAAGLVAVTAAPVAAQEQPNAAVNGLARASGIFVPFAVNPNFDFWPVYSLSETDNNSSHGLSAGFWPGFLPDATFFQFGYQPFERAAFGVAESLWPNTPNEASAATHDFEKFCKSGEVSTVPLPFGLGEGAFPEPLLTGCQSMYAQYRPFVPWEAAAAETASDELFTAGRATGASFAFGPVRIEQVRSTSRTDARGLRAVEAEARVLMRDIAIGPDLRIKEMRSRAAVAAGKDASPPAHRITIVDATYQDQQVEITDEGVTIPGVGSIDEQLAAQGIEVRLIHGGSEVDGTTAQASTGGLVIRMRRNGPPSQFDAPRDLACDTLDDLQPAPVGEVERDLATNPTYDQRPPYDQTPETIGVNESVPPSVLCPLFLMQRALDIGIVLGGANAAARYQALPPIPDFDFGDFGNDFGSFDPFPPVSFPGGVAGPGPQLPSFGEVPPVPIEDVTRSAALDLGPEAARRVRVIYAGMAIVLAMTLVGRRVFRTLVMQ